ncbi:hypothetical protein Tco_0993356 [Tanacetum coccineum]|uniref:Uncharacterized protein n=1 Tax=Tanacetum coccineum TaxID=301880 RepID=A0ABQ5F6G0_9ASTR
MILQDHKCQIPLECFLKKQGFTGRIYKRGPLYDLIASVPSVSFSCNSKTKCDNVGSLNKRSLFSNHKSSTSKSCFVCGSTKHLIKDCDYYEKRLDKGRGSRNNATKRKTPIDISADRSNLICADSYNSAEASIPAGYVIPARRARNGRPTTPYVQPFSHPQRPLHRLPSHNGHFYAYLNYLNSFYGESANTKTYALVTNPIVRESLVCQFWATASEVSLPDGAVGIEATIDGHAHTIAEASIRTIGYVPDQGVWRLCFFKNKFSPQWKFLVHTLIHCIDSKVGSWNQIGSHMASALLCLAHRRPYNFSSLIFQSMVSNITGTKKFLMVTSCALLPSMLNIVDESMGQSSQEVPQMHPDPTPSIVVTSSGPTVDPGQSSTTTVVTQGMGSSGSTPVVPSDPLSAPVFPIIEEETGGGPVFESLLRSPHVSPPVTPPVSTTEGVVGDPVTLTSLSLVVNSLVQKVSSLENALTDMKQTHGKSIIHQAHNKLRIWSFLSDCIGYPAKSSGLAKQIKPSLLFTASTVVSTATVGSPIYIICFQSTVEKASSPLRIPPLQRLAEEEEREQRDKAELSSMRQTELDAYACNLTDAEWVDVRLRSLMRKRRKELAAQKAKEKCEKPMTQAQQRDFMRTFVKNQSTAVYTVGWSMTDVRSLDDAHLLDEYNKIRRALDRINAQTTPKVAPQHSPSSISAATVSISADAVKEDIPSGTTSPRRSGRKKTFTKKKATSSTTTPTLTYYYIEEGDPDAEYKQFLGNNSLMNNVPSVELLSGEVLILAHWEVLSILIFGLGGNSSLFRWRMDLNTFNHDSRSFALNLGWHYIGEDGVHVLETVAGTIVYMLADKTYPIALCKLLQIFVRTRLATPELMATGKETSNPFTVLSMIRFPHLEVMRPVLKLLYIYHGAEDIDLLLDTGQQASYNPIYEDSLG